MTTPYEIEHLHLPEDSHDSCLGYVSMLTGYSIEELRGVVEKRLAKDEGWYSSDFKKTFQKLGFNCPDRFTRFDWTTNKPCLVRFKHTARGIVGYMQEGHSKEKAISWWNVLVYNQGMLHDVHEEAPFALGNLNLAYKITTMLPVTISDISTLPASWRK